MSPRSARHHVQTYVDQELYEQILREAAVQRQSVSECIRAALEEIYAIREELGRPLERDTEEGSPGARLGHRVLGQFDTGLPALDHDNLFLVVPNVEAFARDNGIELHQIRMWAALREVTNHAILNVEWVRGFFVEKVTDFYATVEFDPSGLMDMMSGMQDPSNIPDPSALEDLVNEPGGFARLLGSTHDAEALAPIQAFIAFMEGFGDYAVRTAASDLIPELDRIEGAVALRRSEPNEAEQFLQQLLGLQVDRHRADEAAGFCTEVERRWGAETLERLWEKPAKLPRLEELTDPVGWAARVLLD